MWLLFISLAILLTAVILDRVFKVKFLPFGMMAAASADVDTPTRDGKKFSYGVTAAVHIYAGTLVVLDSSGYAKPGVTATGLIAAGRACYEVDNSSGSNGDLTVEVEHGVFRFNNSASTDLITIAQIGDVCYIVDDNTVAKTSATGTRSVAGYIVDVDADGVWVEVKNTQSADGDLVAANNLSDVADAATARANIGANRYVLQLKCADITSASALVYRAPVPLGGTIKKIYSVIDGALATGDVTLTGKINTTAITNGVVTITQSGSAAGDVDVATPTAANVVVAGDFVSLTVGGTNTQARVADVAVLIEY